MAISDGNRRQTAGEILQASSKRRSQVSPLGFDSKPGDNTLERP